MKKILMSILSFCMMFSLCMQGVFASEESVEVSAAVEDKIEDMIEVEDGYFDLSNQDVEKIEDLIGKEYTDALVSFLEVYNEAVDEGEIEITDNGTIIDLEDEDLCVQGGNVTKTKTYWWGVKHYMSHSKAKTYLNDITKITSALSATVAISKLIGKVLGFTGSIYTKLACELVSMLGKKVYSYCDSLRKRCKSVYNSLSSSSGLVVEFKIWTANSVYKQ